VLAAEPASAVAQELGLVAVLVLEEVSELASASASQLCWNWRC
jgi:hypothetical protein